jgi:hypothetical protein
MPVTVDRGEIIHHAGRHALSPALDGGRPVLLARGEAGARCGWEPFFSALAARGEALDLASDGGWRAVRRPGGPDPSEEPSAPAAFLRRAVATARALRGRAP